MGVQFKVPFFGFCPGVTATVVLMVLVVLLEVQMKVTCVLLLCCIVRNTENTDDDHSNCSVDGVTSSVQCK